MGTAYTHTGAPEAEPSPPITAEPTKPLPTLVFFIGGCTFAELAAVRWLGRHESPTLTFHPHPDPNPNSSPNPHQVRWLGRHESPPREYIVATTHMCNGDDIVQSLVTSLENNLTRL